MYLPANFKFKIAVQNPRYRMFAKKLKNWCRWEGLEETRALLTVVPEGDIALIEEVLQKVKCLGAVCVRGRMLTDAGDALLVLCECSKKLTEAQSIPPEVVE